MNKNHVISALVILTLIGAISGSVSHMKGKLAEEERNAAVAELTELKSQKNLQVDEILGKSAQLQADLQARDKQLRQAREELIDLRKLNKSLESDVSARNTALQKIEQEKNALMSRLADVRAALEKQKRMGMSAAAGQASELLSACEKKLGKTRGELAQLKIALQRKEQQIAASQAAAATSVEAANEIKSLRKKLQDTEAATVQLEQKLAATQSQAARQQTALKRTADAARAQVIGMEKIIHEKNKEINEGKGQIDRLNTNMNVLLNKIAEQGDALQAREKEAQAMLKELADKNREISELQEKILQLPVQ